ncbi:MAG: response regulator [Alphaproteobacteria bacterium]|nr:response regulator [Alphaproteobacteria bacterium]
MDDDDAVRDSMRALLESHYLSVDEFSSGSALLDAEGLNHYDCFVFDFHMPGMNGLELAEAVRRRGVDSAAILVSALAVSASQERMRSAGVIASLMKPVSESELLGWIDRATAPAAAHQ